MKKIIFSVGLMMFISVAFAQSTVLGNDDCDTQGHCGGSSSTNSVVRSNTTSFPPLSGSSSAGNATTAASQRNAQVGAVADALGNAFSSLLDGLNAPTPLEQAQAAERRAYAAAAMQANGMLNQAAQDPRNNPFGNHSNSGENSIQAASENPSQVDLGSTCDQAQQNAAAYISQLSNSQGSNPSVCGSAQTNKKAGQIMLRVSMACQNIPTWTQLRDQANKMIQQSDQTISGSCN